jgi:hypothetical protein
VQHMGRRNNRIQKDDTIQRARRDRVGEQVSKISEQVKAAPWADAADDSTTPHHVQDLFRSHGLQVYKADPAAKVQAWPRPDRAQKALDRLRQWADPDRLAQHGGQMGPEGERDLQTVRDSCVVLDGRWQLFERVGNYWMEMDLTPAWRADLEAVWAALPGVLDAIQAATEDPDLPALVKSVEVGRDVQDRATVREWLAGTALRDAVPALPPGVMHRGRRPKSVKDLKRQELRSLARHAEEILQLRALVDREAEQAREGRPVRTWRGGRGGGKWTAAPRTMPHEVDGNAVTL